MAERDDKRPSPRLNRRDFVASALAAGALASLPACARRGPPPFVEQTVFRISPVAPFERDDATIADLQAAMRDGKTTSRSLVERYLSRIAAADRGDRGVNAVLEANPDALAIADALDAERKTKGARGPLHGIPILIKDNIATADRMQTTAGSLALVGATPERDAFVAERLRAAGAVLLGKTNLSEWANFRSTHSSSGWSARGGQCRNPYALDRTPSGSSSGSAVAVAANFCAAAVGTETDGSIVSPAASCSVVGIKPTVGLVSRSGIIPIAHSQDTAGPMARAVADAAALLTALAGVDARDAATAESAGRASADYTKFLDADGLRGARIGVPREQLFGTSAATDALIDDALTLMRQRGAEIVDPAPLTLGQGAGDAEFEVLLYEFKADLNAYLAELGAPAGARSLEELIAFNERHRAEEMPYFGQEIFVMAQKKGPLTEAAYREALAKSKRLARDEGIDATMDKFKLDAIVAPTRRTPPSLIDLVNGDPSGGGSSRPAAVAGYPHVTVPAGYVRGLPVGISFFGRAWSEPTLIRLAYAFEQASKRRRAPTFAPTANLASKA